VSDDPEEQARHRALAAAAPDAEVADLLEGAARRARSRGAPDAAAELLELSVRLTPVADEGACNRRKFDLAQDLYVGGEMERAREYWHDLAETAPHGADRARALCELARFLEVEFDETERLLTKALAEAEGDGPLQAMIELTWARASWWAGKLGHAETHADAAVTLAERAQDASVLAQALAQAGSVAFLQGRPEWISMIERGIAVELELESPLPLENLPRMYRALLYERLGDDLDATRRALHEVRTLALDRGDQRALAVVGVLLCFNECSAGDLELAAEHAREGAAYAEEAEVSHLDGSYKLAFALIDAYEGRTDEVLASLPEILALEEARGLANVARRCRELLGFVELSLGRPDQALVWLEPAWRLLADAGYVDPGMFQFVPNQVEALVLLGRLDEADERLSSFLATARKLGRRWAIAEGERCSGLLLAAKGRIDEAEAALQRAVHLSEALGQPLLLGRALPAQGTVARRAKRKRDADGALARAQEVFERAGIALLAERARAERARVGLRPRAPSELTETEQRVAELAAAGRRNGEIAAELFMSVHAVEANLTRAYRKLGIRSRSELALRLAHARRG
jgi:DNA-binding CsgD family transcriptional regulator